MKVKEPTFDVGVIVGRFQVPELHEAHIELIQHVCDQHGKVLLFLGLSEIKATQENPLDFEARNHMIQERFPEINVLYISDMAHDKAWSKKLDNQIEHHITPSQTVLLYGGRDSFVNRYHGKFETRELESERYFSGTEIRKDVSRKSVRRTADFRAGVVWATFNRYPTAYTTVDVAIFNEDESKILLARKEHEEQWRLIGGFSTPNSETFEQDARREAQEEAGVAITDPQYVASQKISDWRYREETDQIKTLLFKAKVLHGPIRAGDDVVEVKWFDVVSLSDGDIVPNHRSLIEHVVPKHSQR